ncbi:MAG: type 1 glutamine amidotransferase [Actinomycetia bacterium]|nr:type 1 glutamine amidotransferase [Actinomycetes bacterium]
MLSERDHKRVLVLAHELEGPACQIEVRLLMRGWEVTTHLVTADHGQPNVATPFPELVGYDMLVVMGSVRSLTNTEEIDSWIHDELEMVRMAHTDGMPVLGVCFGGQIIAEALGGSVEKAPVTEIGWYKIAAPEGAENPVGPGPWFEWHHDRFVPPPGADVLAVNENAVQLMRLGRTVGTQFHPEVDCAHMDGFLEMALDEYLDDHGVDRHVMKAEMAEHEGRNRAQCHALVDWFLDEVAFSGSAS